MKLLACSPSSSSDSDSGSDSCSHSRSRSGALALALALALASVLALVSGSWLLAFGCCLWLSDIAFAFGSQRLRPHATAPTDSFSYNIEAFQTSIREAANAPNRQRLALPSS